MNTAAPAQPKPARDARHFERWAPRYDRSRLQQQLFGPVHAAALDACEASGPAPRDVLDLGCGTGRLLALAAGRWAGARLTGLDPSAAMLWEARRAHGDSRLAFVRGDAAAPPLAPASFDAVFSTISFHHWRRQAAGIGAVAQVLRPGGRFVLADVDWPLGALSRPLLSWAEHAHYRGPGAIRQMLEAAGLTIVRQERLWRLVRIQLFVARRA